MQATMQQVDQYSVAQAVLASVQRANTATVNVAKPRMKK